MPKAVKLKRAVESVESHATEDRKSTAVNAANARDPTKHGTTNAELE